MTGKKTTNNDSPRPDVAAVLADMASRKPSHAGLITGLTELFTARARLVDSLTLPDVHTMLEKDKARFLQGAPLLPRARLPFDTASLKACREALAPALIRTFPRLARELEALDQAFASGALRLTPRLRHHLAKQGLPDAAALRRVGASQEAAGLYLGQIAKALAEAAAKSIAGHAVLEGWTKGYCPVCGSPPELSYLEGVEGRRRLSCSLCATTWRYARVACPSCESVEKDDIEIFYADGVPAERAEACNACKRYVLAVDRREQATPVIYALEPLGLPVGSLDVLHELECAGAHHLLLGVARVALEQLRKLGLVPLGELVRAVVRDRVGGRVEVAAVEPDDGNGLHAEFDRRLEPRVAGDHFAGVAAFAGGDRVGDAMQAFLG